MNEKKEMHPVLQNRWKLEGSLLKYYGLRNYPHTLQRVIRLSAREKELVKALDGSITLGELARDYKLTQKVKRLLDESILVDVEDVRKIPGTPEESRCCVRCTANDFIIPGLEFNNEGKCALCQAEENITGQFSTPMAAPDERELLSNTRKNRKSRFDVALMYTGGKDSSFLLYYLAKVCGLRVLACTWAIPFMSPNAKANIQAAKERLKNVEFIERSILPEHLHTMYKASMELQGNTCLCPSLAYVVFYPLLVCEQVPYILAGVEEVQHKNLILNGFISPLIYRLANSSFVRSALNLSRIMTLRPPYKNGQLETVMYFKQLVYGKGFLKRITGYRNEMLEHLNTVFHTVPGLLEPLQKTLRKIDRSRNIPIFINLDLNAISPDGVYDWEKVKEILKKELGWQGTGEDNQDKGLHTSCIVEDGKDYSQFIRFRNMESMLIPFSAIELSIASSSGNITRERAMQELKQMPGFRMEPPLGHQLMQACDGLPCKELCGVYRKTVNYDSEMRIQI